jgi:hypothetical protein
MSSRKRAKKRSASARRKTNASAKKQGKRSPGARHGRERRIVDAIRIVPIAAPRGLFPHVAAVPAAPPPSLTYRGGPLLAAVQVFSIYIGAAWSQAQLKALAGQIDGFFRFVLSSALIDQLSEYDVASFSIEHGTFLGSTVLSSVAVPTSVTDAWLQNTLQQAITGGAPIPKSGPNVLYFLYLPPGITVVQGGARSCQSFCGYHDSIDGKIFYAAMPYPNCNGCLGNLTVLDALTSTSSHELCEAITDPVPGTGWYDDANGEIGDICAWQTRKLGAYTVQLEWSNSQRSCR